MSRTFRLMLGAAGIAALLLAAPLACEDDPVVRPTDGSVGGDADTGGGGPKLVGKVKDGKGVAVASAKVVLSTLAGSPGFTSSDGSYTIDNPPAGAAKLSVTQDWFKEKKDVDVTVAATGNTTLDISMEVWPLKIDAADQTLADTYNKTFDWTKDKLAITALASPTRANLDRAIYSQNPALYRDTASEPSVDSMLTLTGFAGKFATSSGPGSGTDVLVASSVADDIGSTALTSAEQQDYMIWRPLLNWLKNWDSALTKVQDLAAVDAAVHQQAWKGNSVKPQRLERIFLHNGELWAQIIFEPFVKVGSDITDKDADGYKEVYGKIDPKLYSTEVVTAIKSTYIGTKHDTNGLSLEVNEALNELYSVTSATVVKYIGQPYTLPGSLGTINYPFVVLEHSATGGKVYQVLLAGP